MGYKIITLNEKDEWIYYIRHADTFDFYHTWQYHSSEKEHDPILFLYEEKEDYIVLPAIKRKIAGSAFYDLTSVYGYVGPIGNRQFNEADNEFLENFQKSFLQFLAKENIICVFSRLHPIINQNAVLNRFGGVIQNGKTVVIDLETPLEIQREKYRKGHKNSILKLRENNFYIKDASSLEGMKIFASIYYENMNRINAAKEYFFSMDYFNNLIMATEFTTRVVLVYLDDKAVAGGVFTFASNIIQVHLLATLTAHLHDSPAKLLIDEMSLIGRELNMKFLHIGGGVGGNQDSLFYWKSGFSNTYLNFETWRFISNQSEYDKIVKKVIADPQQVQSAHFPLYRQMAI